MRFILNFFRFLLIFVCLSVAVYFSGDVVDYLDEWWNAYQNQKQLEELYNDAKPQQPSSPDGEGEGTPVPSGILPQYQELYPINQDLVGWIRIAGGKLSTPVMQRSNDYYLTHDFYHNQNKHGQIYLDERSSPALTDSNTVVYGHNLPSDQSMFHILTNYQDPEYYAQYPTFQLDSLYQEGEYVIFSVFLASTLPEHGPAFDYINHLSFASDAEKQAYINELQKRSLLDTGVEVYPSDRLVTLSTCTYDFSGARLAVVGRKLRPGETAADFGQGVQKAENPLMPAIWEATYGANAQE